MQNNASLVQDHSPSATIGQQSLTKSDTCSATDSKTTGCCKSIIDKAMKMQCHLIFLDNRRFPRFLNDCQKEISTSQKKRFTFYKIDRPVVEPMTQKRITTSWHHSSKAPDEVTSSKNTPETLHFLLHWPKNHKLWESKSLRCTNNASSLLHRKNWLQQLCSHKNKWKFLILRRLSNQNAVIKFCNSNS